MPAAFQQGIPALDDHAPARRRQRQYLIAATPGGCAPGTVPATDADSRPNNSGMLLRIIRISVNLRYLENSQGWILMTLDSLQRGLKYVIDGVDSTDPVVQRLMVLGLVEGTEIELAGRAIGGDPIEYRMFGNAISLRREQARHFLVSPKSTLESTR
jgi:ferrous iron transport protein A